MKIMVQKIKQELPACCKYVWVSRIVRHAIFCVFVRLFWSLVFFSSSIITLKRRWVIIGWLSCLRMLYCVYDAYAIVLRPHDSEKPVIISLLYTQSFSHMDNSICIQHKCMNAHMIALKMWYQYPQYSIEVMLLHIVLNWLISFLTILSRIFF